MPVDPEKCNFVITLYATGMPIKYDYAETREKQEEKVSRFKGSGHYYRIRWGMCPTEDDDDCIEYGDWWPDEEPKSKKTKRRRNNSN